MILPHDEFAGGGGSGGGGGEEIDAGGEGGDVEGGGRLLHREGLDGATGSVADGDRRARIQAAEGDAAVGGVGSN